MKRRYQPKNCGYVPNEVKEEEEVERTNMVHPAQEPLVGVVTYPDGFQMLVPKIERGPPVATKIPQHRPLVPTERKKWVPRVSIVKTDEYDGDKVFNEATKGVAAERIKRARDLGEAMAVFQRMADEEENKYIKID